MTEFDDNFRKNPESRAKVKVPVSAGGPVNRSGMPPWWPPAYLFYGLAATVVLFAAYFAVVIFFGHLTYGPLSPNGPLSLNFTYFAVVFVGTFIWLRWFFVPMWVRLFLAVGGRGHIFVDPDLDPDLRRKPDGSDPERFAPKSPEHPGYIATKDMPIPEYYVYGQYFIDNDPKLNTIKLYIAFLLVPIIWAFFQILNIYIAVILFNSAQAENINISERTFYDIFSISFSIFFFYFYFGFLWNFKLFMVIIYRLFGGVGDCRYIVYHDISWTREKYKFIAWLPWHYMPPAKPVDKDTAADSE